jgi:glyoxylase-like metal-dependent hydrolase (beta-lactamase superfamily II)
MGYETAVRIVPFTCGWLAAPMGLFVEGDHGRRRVPVPAFLIEHPKGRVVFDTGLHPDVQHDAHGRLGAIADVFPAEYRAGEEIAGRLAGCGVDAARVDVVVLSHLHFDHAGGLVTLPNARVVVQRREWTAGHDADLAAALYLSPRDFDHGHDVTVVDGEHDVFGDGRVVCVPTHGHTPGHQSLRVRLDGGEVVLTADACYLRRTLDDERLPPHPYDRDGMIASLRRLRALREAGARLIFGHDPDGWADVPAELR